MSKFIAALFAISQDMDTTQGFSGSSVWKNSPAKQETQFWSLVRKIPWRREWQPTPVFLPAKSHGWRNLEGCSPWCRWGLERTERLHFHFSLSCIGEGNGNTLQCSCLENLRDRGAWWAAVYGIAQSRTWLKQLSSSSNSTSSLSISL